MEINRFVCNKTAFEVKKKKKKRRQIYLSCEYFGLPSKPFPQGLVASFVLFIIFFIFYMTIKGTVDEQNKVLISTGSMLI